MKPSIKWLCRGGLVGALAVSVAGVSLLTAAWHGHHDAAAGTEMQEAAPSSDAAISVKVIRPKKNQQGFVRAVTQPAYIRAYYRADLMAAVAGPVKFIQKNIGDAVAKDEVLVELDVPELVQDVAQKQALVQQADQDARAAEAFVAVAAAAEKAARSLVLQKQAEVGRSAATMKYRRMEYQRFKTLAATNAVVASVVDERMRDAEAAEADWQAAQAAVAGSKAAAEESSAKLAAARVDIDVKKSRVDVAKAELAKVQAELAYATIRAPFPGTIVARHVDPGTFVQNASSGHPVPVLSVVRTDIVTVVMWVPEKYVPYVSKNTEAIIRLDALRGSEIHARVTRFSNWLDPDKSRDMRVEVDLCNSPQLKKHRLLVPGVDLPAAPTPAAVAAGTTTEKCLSNGPLKPGMYGTMKLVLQKFDNAYLVPEGALFERGGQTCIFQVIDGKAHRVPVRVQVDDGTQAKIVKVIRPADPKAGDEEEVEQELTGQEEIIRSGQGEIADGQAVKSVLASW